MKTTMIKGQWVPFGIGFVTGLRSMTGSAALSWAASMGHTRLAWIPGGNRPRGIASAMALAEMAGDKMPFAPDRRTTPALLGRLGIGAAGGAALAGRDASLLDGAFSGIAGAITGTLLGRAFRGATTRSRFDWLRALTEDALAAGLAIALVRSAVERDRL